MMVVLDEINDGLVTVWRWIFMDENVSAIFTRTSIFLKFFFVFGTLSFCFNEHLLEAVQPEKITDREKMYM